MPNVDLLGVAKGDIITVTIEEDEYTLYVTSQHSNAIQAVILDSENSGKYNTYQSLFICDN
jgi:dsDNA-specific endonuclease/ATPase MutS2